MVPSSAVPRRRSAPHESALRPLGALAVLAFVAVGCGNVASTTVTSDASASSTPGPAELTESTPTTAVSTTASSTTSLAPSTTSTSTSTVPARTPIVIGFAGDTTFTDGLDARDPFVGVADLLQQPDLMVVNLETAVADPDIGRPAVAKRFLFRSPPESLDLLVEAGIDVVTLGNNHALDFGPEAMAQTLTELDQRGLDHVGAGNTEEEALEPLVIEVEGWSVGIMSFSRVPCDWSASGENVRPQVAWVCPPFQERAEAVVAEMVDDVDAAIVMVHGGAEGALCPSDFMVDLEHRFSELGVDAVINGHPHVLQGLTRFGDTLVAHSLGNFAFPPARGLTGNSAIVLLELDEEGVAMRVEPVRSEGGVLSVPSEARRSEILAQMNRFSDGVRVEDDGRVVEAAEQRSECGLDQPQP